MVSTKSTLIFRLKLAEKVSFSPCLVPIRFAEMSMRVWKSSISSRYLLGPLDEEACQSSKLCRIFASVVRSARTEARQRRTSCPRCCQDFLKSPSERVHHSLEDRNRLVSNIHHTEISGTFAHFLCDLFHPITSGNDCCARRNKWRYWLICALFPDVRFRNRRIRQSEELR